MRSYGSHDVFMQKQPPPRTNVSLASELRLMASSPGFPVVVLFAVLCYHLSFVVPTHIRPLPGSFVDGRFVINAEVNHEWEGQDSVTVNELFFLCFVLPPIIFIAVRLSAIICNCRVVHLSAIICNCGAIRSFSL